MIYQVLLDEVSFSGDRFLEGVRQTHLPEL